LPTARIGAATAGGAGGAGNTGDSDGANGGVGQTVWGKDYAGGGAGSRGGDATHGGGYGGAEHKAGVANTGGGGSEGNDSVQAGGPGGSGIVIIRYVSYTGYFSGYVYELGNPVQRTVYLHNRSTGELLDTTTSSGNGYYYLETTYSGAHYIVCLDDAAGEDYNDLIIGNVYPTTISG